MEILSSDNFKKLVEQGGEKFDAVLEKAGLQKKNNERNEKVKEHQETITEENN